MCVVTIIAAVVLVSCPDAAKPAESARVLTTAPGLSNRTNVYWLPVPERPVVFTAPSTVSRPKPLEPMRLDGTPLSEPPKVYGIPYPWTPLTWAILHAGTAQPR